MNEFIDYCYRCINQNECRSNNWALTFDIDGIVCDHFDPVAGNQTSRETVLHAIISEQNDYKTGDIVVIANMPVNGMDVNFVPEMERWLGRTTTIKSVRTGHTNSGEKIYKIDIDKCDWNWTASMFMSPQEFDTASDDELLGLLRGV